VTTEDMSALDLADNPQVLIGVFPNEREKEALMALMDRKSLVMGQDWWWL